MESPDAAVSEAPLPRADCTRICVTPTRNEAWIIDRFLGAARMWAQKIIVADQNSTDETQSLIRGFPDVDLIHNTQKIYNEGYRQQLLLNHARRVPGKRILIGLDADEALSVGSAAQNAWKVIEAAPPGTILRFRWVNILPGFEKAWIQPRYIPFGFVDDGYVHQGTTIHSPRVPQPIGAPVLDIDDIVVLHFQYVLWDRMRSKQRWYQVWEHTEHREKKPLQIFREYNHMHGSWNADEIYPLKKEWIATYDDAGVDFRSLKCEPITWWDREVAQIIARRGPSEMRQLAIWDKDWSTLAAEIGSSPNALNDPRTWLHKAIHRLLFATQRHRGSLPVRIFEKLLRLAGW